MTFPVDSILIDRRNFTDLKDKILQEITHAPFVGLDVETEDTNRHAGLNRYCGYREDGSRSKTAKLVFDFQRITMTGFSIYPENGPNAYYFSLAHADVENRLAWEEVKPILDALPESSHFLCHNAPFELSVFRSCFGYDLPRVVCTLQMAVSAFGPDEYSEPAFLGAGQGGIAQIVPEIMQNAMGIRDHKNISNDLQEVMTKVLGKQSTAAHSYNGWTKEISYGYGLKRLAKTFLGHDMVTFEQVLNGRNHMGELTGEEVVSYGCDDAWAVVPLFHKLLEHMVDNCPKAIQTFFDQENPMIHVYSDIQTGGMKVDFEAIKQKLHDERIYNAEVLTKLKAVIRQMLPFPADPHEGLTKRDSWYSKGFQKYRKLIEKWANTPDSADAYTQNQQVRGAVSNAWATDAGDKESTGPNIGHYMTGRILLYDLARTKNIVTHGKTQSDGEARGKLKERFQKEGNMLAVEMIDCMNALASVDQRIKLFITPYTQLTDPETQKLYPTVSSMLATRRMAAQYPNPMQLAKRGESVFVRGFFEGDTDEHVILSCDWSGIELVEIGEFSGDPEFIKAFGQIPHEDLHGGAASAVLSVTSPGLTDEAFQYLKTIPTKEEFLSRWGAEVENIDRLFRDVKGNEIEYSKAFKYWRTTAGKPSSFGYWYSGGLMTTGEIMGWDKETTYAAADSYRQRFAVAEKWRTDLIAEVQREGRITLPDGHTRVRFEATERWKHLWSGKFMMDNPNGDELVTLYNQVWGYMANKIQRRAWNQAVNAMIQGSCATIAKRSIIRIMEAARGKGWTSREFRFLCPIHDELVFSVHKSIVVEAMHLVRDTMIDHPDLFTKCKLDASPSIGLNFAPYDAVKNPGGQIELFESPDFDFVAKERRRGRMNDDEIRGTVDYLFSEQRRLAA